MFLAQEYMKRTIKNKIICCILAISIVMGSLLSFTSLAMTDLFANESNEISVLDEKLKSSEDSEILKVIESSEDSENLELIENPESEISESEELNLEKQEDNESEEFPKISEELELNIETEPTLETDSDLITFTSSNYPNTITIENAEDLVAFLNGGLGSNADEYILMDNIDMTGRGTFRGRWANVAFSGRFASLEGEQFTISNLALIGRNVNAETFGGNDIGFIRTAGDGAIIENVIFDGITFADPVSNVSNWASSHKHIGLVIGRVEGGEVEIRNVKVLNFSMALGTVGSAISHTNTRVGGLMGSIASSSHVTLHNLELSGDLQMIRGTGQTTQGGGLVGEVEGNLTLQQSEINVNVLRNLGAGHFGQTGGVVGRRTSGNVLIEHVEQNGNVEGSQRVGGFVGDSSGTGSLTLNHVSTSGGTTISASDTSRLGGLVGSAVNNTTITESENHAAISTTYTPVAHSDVGGLVGFGEGGITINDSNNFGNLTMLSACNSRMAGILARSEGNVSLVNVQNRGDLTRPGNTGVGDSEGINGNNNRLSAGILGSANVNSGFFVSVDNAKNYGNIPSRIKLSAGIVGRFTGEGSGQVIHSINYGNIDTHERAGGIVGRNELLNLLIDGCFNYGRISALGGSTSQNMMGGILSSSQTQSLGQGAQNPRYVTISNSGNRGNLSSGAAGGGWNGTGGIAGWIPNEGLRIENSYNAGHIHSTATSTPCVGGIIGTLEYPLVNIWLTNVYSIGPVTVGTTLNPTNTNGNGNGILGDRRNTGTGGLRMENVYVSAFFSGNAITDATTNNVVSTNVYIDTSTARTTDTARLQTGLPGVTAVTSEQLTSGTLPGLSGGPWKVGIANEPHQRTFPYFSWQTGGAQQESFFKEINSTNVELFAGDTSLRLRGIVDYFLTNTGNVDVLYSLEGFEHNNVRIFNPNNGGLAHSNMESALEERSIPGTLANIPSRRLTTGLISANDVVAFDEPPGHRVTFDVNGGWLVDETPLRQLVSHGQEARLPLVERDNYTFDGWNTQLDGTGKHYPVGESIEITEDIMLYAVWKPMTTSLAISKEVTGDLANKIVEFEFIVYFQCVDEKPLPAGTTLYYLGDTLEDSNANAPEDGVLTLDSDGSATFGLSHGQIITIDEIPMNGYVRIIVTPDEIYMASYERSGDPEPPTIGNDTNMLPVAKEGWFHFISERIYVPPMGVEVGSTSVMPLLAVIVVIPASILFGLRVVSNGYKNRKR